MRMNLVVVFISVAAATGCIDSDNLLCSDGRMCPTDRVCDEAHASCVPPEEIEACNGKAQLEPCSAEPFITDGVCRESVCIALGCGNGFVDPGEACDDANTTSGDGCRADCLSDERCGNGVIDVGERCDDGNLVSHDGCDSRCNVEQAAWSRLVQTPSPSLSAFGFAYDDARHRLVAFGGYSATGPTGKTFEFDGRAWLERQPRNAPPPRQYTVMAYDAARHRVVLFGGVTNDGIAADTWLWDGVNWIEQSASGPKPRFSQAMSYDAARQRVVMFGGFGTAASGFLADTWLWDGAAWSEVKPSVSPSARSFCAAAYDPHRKQVVIEGGFDGVAASTQTWLWDGVTWSAAPDGPGLGLGAAMSYSPALDALVLTGSSPTSASDVWRWDGRAWLEEPAASAADRVFHGSYFDPDLGATMLVSGQVTNAAGMITASNQLWSYNDRTTQTWTAITSAAPPISQRVGGAVAYDSEAEAVWLFGGANPNFNGELWELAGATWRQVQAVAAPPKTVSAGIAYDERRGVTVVFGGTVYDNAVYEWGRSDAYRSQLGVHARPRAGDAMWTKHDPIGSWPVARNGTALAYDRVRGIVLLFGGSSGSTYFDDTWSWDGTAWTHLTGGPTPARRANHRLAYDARRGKIVLFGGDTDVVGGTVDTWEWDGEWKQMTPTSDSPEPRTWFGMTYDAVLGETLVIGGTRLAESSSLSDAWRWNGTRWKPVIAPNGPGPLHQHAVVYDPALAATVVITLGGNWLLRWESETLDDVCEVGLDLDGDGRSGCDDPDCWYTCTSSCPPAASCSM
jgi:cysteine-rich repeat protein